MREEKEDALISSKEKLSIVERIEDKNTCESQMESFTPAQIPTKEKENAEEIIEAPKGEIINCPFCEKELSSDMIFCLRCGKKLNK